MRFNEQRDVQVFCKRQRFTDFFADADDLLVRSDAARERSVRFAFDLVMTCLHPMRSAAWISLMIRPAEAPWCCWIKQVCVPAPKVDFNPMSGELLSYVMRIRVEARNVGESKFYTRRCPSQSTVTAAYLKLHAAICASRKSSSLIGVFGAKPQFSKNF